MRKLAILLAFAILSVFFAAHAAPVNAASSPAVDPFETVCDSSTQDSPACAEDTSNPIAGPDGVLTRVVQILAFVIGAASVIMVILGGFKYVTSGGDSNSTASAKNTILYALIGLAVAGLAQAIVIFIIRQL